MRLTDGWLLTPTNVALGSLQEKHLCVLDAEGAHVDGDPPTKEAPFHRALYRARANCGAVVHLHSTYAVAYSCLADLKPTDAMPPITPYTVMRLGRVGVVEYVRPGDERLASLVGEAAREHHAILLANHGSVVAAPSLDAALAVAEELEESAKLYFILRGEHTRLLSAAQVRELEEAFPT